MERSGSSPHETQNVVVQPIDGKMTLMLRTANVRLSVVTQTSAHLYLLRFHTTPEGHATRRIEDLALVRNWHHVFVLGWNLMYVIDQASPLYGVSLADLKASEATLMLTIEGIDATTAQTLAAGHHWGVTDIRRNHRYADFIHRDDRGVNLIDYTRFDDVLPLDS